ncbi:MAG: (2Fe-2S) ferredoxin domain-containing protein, partial [Proteobacteria bacterium]|nr:(2Fe-2S) ferredoxin domain-containing protein [Pseudomonadota bacterium]
MAGHTVASSVFCLRQYVTASIFLYLRFPKHHRRNDMKKITVCIGSSCHLKGSRQVVEMLQYFIAQNKLDDKVELNGTFCMGNCQKGVCVTV